MLFGVLIVCHHVMTMYVSVYEPVPYPITCKRSVTFSFSLAISMVEKYKNIACSQDVTQNEIYS